MTCILNGAYGNGPLSRITFSKYTAFALLDSADPKRTGVRIVVVLKLLDSMAKLMGKELSKVHVKSHQFH